MFDVIMVVLTEVGATRMIMRVATPQVGNETGKRLRIEFSCEDRTTERRFQHTVFQHINLLYLSGRARRLPVTSVSRDKWCEGICGDDCGLEGKGLVEVVSSDVRCLHGFFDGS
jgi:hypothetical protein